MLTAIFIFQEVQKQVKEHIYLRGCSLLIDYMANNDGIWHKKIVFSSNTHACGSLSFLVNPERTNVNTGSPTNEH